MVRLTLVAFLLVGCATPEPAVVKTVQVGSVFNCNIYLTYVEDTSVKRYWEKCDER
jgi:hypothetical protein